MNNKIVIKADGAIPKTVGGNLAWRGSGTDELYMFSEDWTQVRDSALDSAIAQIDTTYIPENLSDVLGVLDVYEALIRQDVKRRLATRLPRVTLAQGLIIASSADNFAQYFINSYVIFNGYDYIRWGLANFTSDQATNPFAEGQQPVLNAVWSFFDVLNP
jgi:hypothetical protein